MDALSEVLQRAYKWQQHGESSSSLSSSSLGFGVYSCMLAAAWWVLVEEVFFPLWELIEEMFFFFRGTSLKKCWVLYGLGLLHEVQLGRFVLAQEVVISLNRYCSSYSWRSSRGGSSIGLVGTQICHCGDVVVLRVENIVKNEGKQFSRLQGLLSGCSFIFEITTTTR